MRFLHTQAAASKGATRKLAAEIDSAWKSPSIWEIKKPGAAYCAKPSLGGFLNTLVNSADAGSVGEADHVLYNKN